MNLQWIKARAWRRALFYGLLFGLPMGVIGSFAFVYLHVARDNVFEWWYLCYSALLMVMSVIVGVVAGFAMLLNEKFRTRIYRGALARFETIELEHPVIGESVGFLSIRAPLQWFPFTIANYVAPGPRFPWLCFVDERPVATFNQGETVTIPLTAGRYSVMVGRKLVPLKPGKHTLESDYTNSVPVEIQAGETITLDLRLRKVQMVVMLIGVALISWWTWNPWPWLPAWLEHLPNGQLFPRLILGYLCLLPLFGWIHLSRTKKHGFMTALTVVKPGNYNELVELDAEC